MKLLNLWPQNEMVTQPTKRFLLEVVFALLLVAVITLASWLWIFWRLNHARVAHQTLQSEWIQLKKQKEVDSVSIAQSPRALRQMIAGSLDWMGELPQWTQGGRVRWLSAKNTGDLLALEGVAQDRADIDAMVAQIRARYPQPPIWIDEITSVTVDGSNWWRFSMRVEGVGVLYRWVLSPASIDGSAPATPEASHLTGAVQ